MHAFSSYILIVNGLSLIQHRGHELICQLRIAIKLRRLCKSIITEIGCDYIVFAVEKNASRTLVESPLALIDTKSSTAKGHNTQKLLNLSR